MNLFCKIIIGCNPKMMDFITYGFWHCVIRDGKDSGVMRVDKDSRHGTCLSLISSHGIILFGICELRNVIIACALRWGVALVGSLLY